MLAIGLSCWYPTYFLLGPKPARNQSWYQQGRYFVTTTDAASIDSLFEKFLGEQHKRVKDKTFGRYVMIIDLFRGYLNSYGHLDLDDADQHRFQAAFDHDEDAFWGLGSNGRKSNGYGSGGVRVADSASL